MTEIHCSTVFLNNAGTKTHGAALHSKCVCVFSVCVCFLCVCVCLFVVFCVCACMCSVCVQFFLIFHSSHPRHPHPRHPHPRQHLVPILKDLTVSTVIQQSQACEFWRQNFGSLIRYVLLPYLVHLHTSSSHPLPPPFTRDVISLLTSSTHDVSTLPSSFSNFFSPFSLSFFSLFFSVHRIPFDRFFSELSKSTLITMSDVKCDAAWARVVWATRQLLRVDSYQV
jgi:hypothetical protein